MKLYYSPGACSLVIRILIHELNQNAEYVKVDLKTKKLENGEDYLKINPKGAVPALEIEDGLLTENAVIQQYLADQFEAKNLLPAITDFKRYRILEWVNFITTDIHKTFGPLFNAQFPDEVKKEFILPLLVKKFGFLDKQVGNKSYLVAEEFTLPDAYAFVVLRWADKMQVDLSEYKNLARYYKFLQERESIKQSLQEEFG